MATFNKFNSFVEAKAHAKHDFSADQVVVALTNSAPTETDAVLADIVEVSYTNLSSRNVTTTSSSQTNGVYKLVLADLVLTASGTVGPFRYIVLYNDTATNKDLICWYDRGSSLTLEDTDTFTINFDDANGVFTEQ